MKIVRFQIPDDGSVYYGELKNNTIYEIINFSFQQRNYNFGRIFPITDIELLSPVTPEKVVGLAYNYKDLVFKNKLTKL